MARQWHWYTCPVCFNDRAGKEPGDGRITAELVQTRRPTYAATNGRAPRTLTLETWRLTCPCGHVWDVHREAPPDAL